MKKTIQIIVLYIYFITSCFVIGENKWKNDVNSKDTSFSQIVFSFLTIPISDYIDGNENSLLLIKNPKDEKSVVADFSYFFLSNEFVFKPNYFYSEEKIKDPFFFIFSPPPLFS